MNLLLGSKLFKDLRTWMRFEVETRGYPVFFIGPRRSGTTAIYDCLYQRNQGVMSRVKETFIFSTYNPDFEVWIKSRGCKSEDIIDFCPGVYGSPLSYANLRIFADQYNVRPALIVIHREKSKALESCLNYFVNRQVLSSEKEELAVDSAFQQYFQVEISEEMRKHFDIREFQFEDVMVDGLGALGEYLTSAGIDFDSRLIKRNSQDMQFRSGPFALGLISIYRNVRKYLPEKVFDYLQSSSLAKKLLVRDGSDSEMLDTKIYTEKLVKILCEVGNKKDSEI